MTVPCGHQTLLNIRYMSSMSTSTEIPTTMKNFLESRLSNVSILFLLLNDIILKIWLVK